MRMASVLLSVAGNIDGIDGHPVSPSSTGAEPVVSAAVASPQATSAPSDGVQNKATTVPTHSEPVESKNGSPAIPTASDGTTSGNPVVTAGEAPAEGWLYSPQKSDSWCAWFSRPWALLFVSMWRDLFALRWYQGAFMLVSCRAADVV